MITDSIIKYRNAHLTFLDMDDKYFDGLDITTRFPREVYVRLLLAQLLPKKIEKYYAAVVAPPHVSVEPYKRLGLSTENSYSNSGVMLLNMNKIRDDFSKDAFISYYVKHYKEKNYLLIKMF